MITKMTILQHSALSADSTRGLESIAKEVARTAEMYTNASGLFKYLSMFPKANIKDAFVMFFNKEPDMKAKSKKERSWSVGMVYVHEVDEQV